MHALHSLAHRAPPATRTRVRWQPYSISALSSVAVPSRSPSSYLITPASSVTSSPPSDLDRTRPSLPSTNSQVLKDFPFRDSSRNKYAIGLVDQAVKTLCEIWHPQDVPSVFLSSSRPMVNNIGAPHDTNLITGQKPPKPRSNDQLPSPVSPSTQASPPPPSAPVPLPPTPVSAKSGPQLMSDQDTSTGSDPHHNLLPIKGFVHEVLRRSRTSGCVLQTALCYLEAIRPKIPEIARQEKAAADRPEDSPERITMATEAELQAELDHNTEPNNAWDSVINTEKCLHEDSMDTVRVHDDDLDGLCSSIRSLSQDLDTASKPQPSNSKIPSSTPSSSPLPSPLLCPRRAFLASLILASKFTQDKCYSNRAWAKLSGLPPREIGRCERALGQALEWRLWVGKRPVAAQSSPTTTKRPVVRSQSESSLLQSASNQTAFLVWNEKSAPSAQYSSSSRSTSCGGLRRCATLPTEAFVAPISEPDKAMGNPSIHELLFDLNDTSDQETPSVTPAPSYPNPCPTDMMNSSPSPATPSLSYSPSSTGSSSGDRTIQMSTFSDESMMPFNSNYRGILNSEICPWLDNPDGTESSSMMCYGEKAPQDSEAPLLSRSFGEDGLSPYKAPPPLAISHLWAPTNTLMTCPYGPE